MSTALVRGDGVGIEVGEAVLRGVRLRPELEGRVAYAAEISISLQDDDAAVDAFVMLRAELGEPRSPTRIAAFSQNAMMQRVDITGRSGPDLNALRAKLQRLHDIDSTLILEDGPRRWLLLIRWDSPAMRRLEDLAERAGFVDVTVEPSPLATARIAGPDATHATRLVDPGSAHHAVLANRLPVCALGVDGAGRTAPDLLIGHVDVTLALFDDFEDDADLAATMDTVRERSDAERRRAGREDSLRLDLVGNEYPPFPDHDQRSPRRQAVALGAAVGAAGLAGPMRPVDMMITSTAVDDQFDRPWAIETIPVGAPPPTPSHPPPPRPRRRFLRR